MIFKFRYLASVQRFSVVQAYYRLYSTNIQEKKTLLIIVKPILDPTKNG